MDLNQIKLEWEKDSVISSKDLQMESLKVPTLHSKYLNELIDSKSQLSKFDEQLNILRQRKRKYFRGEMGKEELEKLGWTQWPYNKILKTEIQEHLDGDSDCIELNRKVEYYKIKVYFLESVLGQLKARDFQIKNSIEWQKYILGN